MIKIKEFSPQDSQADSDRLLPIYLELWNHPSNLRFLLYSMKPLTPKQLRFEFMHHRLIGERYFAAMEGDAVLGLSVLKTAPADLFEISGVAVFPEHQRRGIGRQLVQHAQIIARWEGFDSMETTVFSDNAPMLNLMRQEGFEQIAVTTAARADGVGLIRLQKRLPDHPNCRLARA